MRIRIAALILLAACAGRREPPPLTEIPSPAAPGSGEPNLTTGPDGRVYLSWIEPAADSTHALRWAALEGGRWGAPGTIAAGRGWIVNWADFPMLQVGPTGFMSAHWLERTGAGYAYQVRVARSADRGHTWTAGVVPHGDGVAAEHGFVAMWPGAADSVGLAWLDGRANAGKEEGDPSIRTMLRAGSVSASGGAGPDVALDEMTCDCCQTAAAMTADGPLVVYRDRTPDEIRDIYVVRRVGGRWTAPAPVSADGWHIDACPVNGPAVAADGRRVAVAWFTGAGDQPRVLVAFSDDAGATWGRPTRLDGGAPAGRVDVELVDGAAVVSWLEQVTGGAEVRVRRIGSPEEMGAPLTVATSSEARSSGFPRMARDGDGVVLAWTVPGQPARVRTARLALEAL